jgi:hypothetical protein
MTKHIGLGKMADFHREDFAPCGAHRGNKITATYRPGGGDVAIFPAASTGLISEPIFAEGVVSRMIFRRR